jgi:hypothetical protein
MDKLTGHRGILLLSLGVVIGLAPSLVRSLSHSTTVMAQDETKAPAPDLAAMQADIAHLKEVVPSQSHTMTDVAYQFAELWFAGRAKNWPLADFFLNETRSHIAWTIRIRPVRRDSAGNPVDIKTLFDMISNGQLKNLADAVKARDEARFEASYKQMLNGCNNCHIAADKPYLHVVIPQTPPQTIVQFEPRSE